MLAEYDGRQIVGIDLHRRRTVILRMTEAHRGHRAVHRFGIIPACAGSSPAPAPARPT